MSDPILELRAVTKRFGEVVANDEVSLSVRPGSVHAIVGENGAGKSTLMKIAYGQLRADAGEIVLKGDTISRDRHSPRRAIACGVGMVHQHFMLAGPLTVLENIVLGHEPRRGPLLDLDGARRSLRTLAERFGLHVDPDARIEDLSVGEQQRVEIVKVLGQGCDVLILDEPTAVLTPKEVEQLFGVLRVLVAGGMTIVLITHKLDEVVALADRVTVLRRGRVVRELDVDGDGEGEVTPEVIARAMVGRDVLFHVEKGPAEPGQPVLDVSGLRAPSGRGTLALRGVDLTVRAGEVLGVAGVEGNGQSELIECLVGLRGATAGTIRLSGRDITKASVRERYRSGLGHVPEDRLHRGLVLSRPIEDNLILGRQHEVTRRGVIDRRRVRQNATERIAEIDIRPDDPRAQVAGLSGGNQQKVVVARELSRPHLTALICAQPTRGVDIGAIELIHRLLVEARDRGVGILLLSAELSELESLADRLVVMYRGEIVSRLDAAELATPGARERIGEAMTGARESTA